MLDPSCMAVALCNLIHLLNNLIIAINHICLQMPIHESSTDVAGEGLRMPPTLRYNYCVSPARLSYPGCTANPKAVVWYLVVSVITILADVKILSSYPTKEKSIYRQQVFCKRLVYL